MLRLLHLRPLIMRAVMWRPQVGLFMATQGCRIGPTITSTGVPLMVLSVTSLISGVADRLALVGNTMAARFGLRLVPVASVMAYTDHGPISGEHRGGPYIEQSVLVPCTTLMGIIKECGGLDEYNEVDPRQDSTIGGCIDPDSSCILTTVGYVSNFPGSYPTPTY